MSTPPAFPRVYHITHIDNILSIIKDGELWSDAERLGRSTNITNVGMDHIKKRRLDENRVACHSNTFVGQYVPFYFCPRSVMLYILWQSNHKDLAYRGGQNPILHLECDLHAIVNWAEKHDIRWAFTNGSAASSYGTDYYNNTKDLDKLNWAAIRASDWRDSIVREKKQAEFLVYRAVPWRAVEAVGAVNGTMAARVKGLLEGTHRPPDVKVVPEWYY